MFENDEALAGVHYHELFQLKAAFKFKKRLLYIDSLDSLFKPT
ncbi:hypothetical protein [Methylicorpusculum sp.]|nr:hypothetical protein [Methylicorpusculum sp.]MDP2178258.1 hypothetical protein [Methylicorpusculum sp.]MDP3530573.1 hypothetical protein [Methylicorpusculum sp.]MDZ4151204.1 hypothetical protein [Methylicorpusculum sp.]